MSKGAPLLKPLGINFSAKQSTAYRVRPPASGEARVAILREDGVLLQEKLGTLTKNGTRCLVRYEGELQSAEEVDGRWCFIVRRPPEDP